ncbi:MAG: efflux RND transporter periplasmic adaptor subunit [Planctomycetes bacterium]|nr:efflux RND transporter periplasmic adaptor subunit [Planctomycetota bacterium]
MGVAVAALAHWGFADEPAGPIVASGLVKAAREVSVSSEVGGLVVEIMVEEGAAVLAGEVLARVDTSRAELELSTNEWELESQVVALEKIQAPMLSEELELKRAEVERAVLKLDEARFGLEESRELLSGGAASARQARQAEAAFNGAELDLRMARLRLALAEKGPWPLDVKAAEVKVEKQRQTVALKRRALDECSIRAPVAGVVVKRYVEPGERLPAGAQVVDLVDARTVHVELNLPLAVLPMVRVGQEARATVALYPAPVEGGRLNFVSPVVDPSSGTFLARLSFPNDTDPSLRPGMFATVTLLARE